MCFYVYNVTYNSNYPHHALCFFFDQDSMKSLANELALGVRKMRKKTKKKKKVNDKKNDKQSATSASVASTPPPPPVLCVEDEFFVTCNTGGVNSNNPSRLETACMVDSSIDTRVWIADWYIPLVRSFLTATDRPIHQNPQGASACNCE